MGCAVLPHLKSLVEIIEHGKVIIVIIVVGIETGWPALDR
jgi:hypothetical protein